MLGKPMAHKTLNLVRVASSGSGARETVDKINYKHEESLQSKKLPTTPESVAVDSTIMPMTGAPGDEQMAEPEPQMMAGIYHDLVSISNPYSAEVATDR